MRGIDPRIIKAIMSVPFTICPRLRVRPKVQPLEPLRPRNLVDFVRYAGETETAEVECVAVAVEEVADAAPSLLPSLCLVSHRHATPQS